MIRNTFLGIGFLAATLFAADCTITDAQKNNVDYPATDINFFVDSYLDLSKMSQLEPATKNLLKTDSAWVYRSNLDQTILVIVAEKYIKLTRLCSGSETCVDSLYTTHYDAVYKDELARLQKAGVFKGSAAQADSLVDHVIGLCQAYYYKEMGYSGCTYNNENNREEPGKDVDMADVPLASVWNIKGYRDIVDTAVFCPEYFFGSGSADLPSDTVPVPNDTAATTIDTATTDSSAKDPAKADTTAIDSGDTVDSSKTYVGDAFGKLRIQNSVGFRKLSASSYAIENVAENAAYTAFDVNGQLVGKGHLNGLVFSTKRTPVILKLEGDRTLYLK